MIFSQKITERGKPDPSECMSFLTAHNLVSRIQRICFWPSRVFGSYSDHIRAFWAALSRWPKSPKTVGTRLFRWTKGNAGSGEENDSKCRQDRSGRPARVVKPWGGGGVLHRLSRSHRMKIYFPFYEKKFGKWSPLWITIQERKSLFHVEKKAESPNTLYHALALRHVRINKLF